MRKIKYDIPYTYQGETRCLSEWAAILGIRYNTLCARVSRGITGDELFEPVGVAKYGRKGTKYTVDGHTGYIYELAEIFGMKYPTVAGRIQRGFSLEKALKTPLHTKEADYDLRGN